MPHTRLAAHYAALGCQIGSERSEQLLKSVERYQTGEARDTLRAAFQQIAASGFTSDSLRTLAEGTWMTFLEPTQKLAEAIDEFAPVNDGIGWPGAFGRQWARSASEVAWTIWVDSAGGNGET